MLKSIEDINLFKEGFRSKFQMFRQQNPIFNDFLLSILIQGTAYVVGGFLRDIINGNDSRDIDIIVDVEQDELLQILKESQLDYKLNRMGGIKILLSSFQVDLWTISNNWAFKTAAVKKNDDYLLDRIADGCFYNYDSLVLNVSRLTSVHFKNYNNCVNTQTLDILRKNDTYKKKNPTTEANILRAFFLAKKFDLNFSENCAFYLAKSIIKIKETKDITQQLNLILQKYEKYQGLLNLECLRSMTEQVLEQVRAIDDKSSKNQFTLKF